MLPRSQRLGPGGADPAARPAAACVEVPPGWRIGPPGPPDDGARLRVVLTPGAGFGDGRHETTQLCLQALVALAPRDGRAWSVLDCGSGSGILAIGAARLGATVAAVEIDAAARAHAAADFQLNGVADRIRSAASLDDAPGAFDLVLCNILRAALLELAPGLVRRLAPRGALVLSGLVATDVPEVSLRYTALCGGRPPQLHARGEWRALCWPPRAA